MQPYNQSIAPPSPPPFRTPLYKTAQLFRELSQCFIHINAGINKMTINCGNFRLNHTACGRFIINLHCAHSHTIKYRVDTDILVCTYVCIHSHIISERAHAAVEK